MKSQFFTAIKSILSAFRSVFFPENCIICSKELEESGTQICENCKENAFIRNVHKDEYFAPLLPFCEDVFVMFHYNYVKKGIISFKFKKQITQGKHLANLLAQGLKNQDWIKEIDYVIPIPLHPKARRKRQFNQCEIIADILSKELGIKKQADNLFRIRYNTPQHNLNAEKRYENVKGNFGLKDKSLLEGKSILLVDDVITTCSTVKACCMALKESKDIKIYACSLATSRVRL